MLRPDVFRAVAGLSVAYSPPGPMKPTDAFRLIWRAGHPREAQLEALGAELRTLPIR